MKQKLFALFLLFACVGNAWGVKIRVNTTTKTAEVVDGYSSGTDVVSVTTDSYDVIIPSQVKYNGVMYDVTSIGYRAFAEISYIRSVVIPQTVTSIGQEAFRGCSELASLTIGDGINAIGGNEVFFGCKSLTETKVVLSGFDKYCAGNDHHKLINPKLYYNDEVVVDYVIPEGVTAIAPNAFVGCSDLISITIPESVTSIGAKALKTGSKNLRKVTMYSTAVPTLEDSNGVPTIPTLYVNVALYNTIIEANNWIAHRSQFIPIGAKTSYSVEVTASNTLSPLHVAIGEDNLQSVVSLKVKGTINSYDLMIINNKMPNLENLDLSEASIVACDYQYHTGYTSHDNMLESYSIPARLLTLKLPNTLEVLGDYALGELDMINELTLPESLTSIGAYAFQNCSGLENIPIPNSVISIGAYAFLKCI